MMDMEEDCWCVLLDSPIYNIVLFTIMSANDVTKSSDLGGWVIITNVPVLIIDMSLSHH